MPTPSLAQARSHYERQRRIGLAALAAIRRLFATDPRPTIPKIAATAAGYQLASATLSSQTVAGYAGAQQPLTTAAAFMGVSSLGFPLTEPIIATIDRIVPAPVEPLPAPWWDDAQKFMGDLERLLLSEVADAGRTASQVEFVARPDWTNYVRMLNPPSCARCTVLAGRVYRDLDAFQRHPMCFPAGTVVSGPAPRGASRRWYQGELVVIRTAGGKELSATANHPILTDQGWVPAHLLTEGGYVVSRASGDRSSALLVPHHDQMPSRIEDLWSADAMSPLGRMPVAPEDFHGDGLGSSHVDVVLADCLLWSRPEVSVFEELREQRLTVRAVTSVALASTSADYQVSQGRLATTARSLSGGSLGLALAGLQFAHSQESGGTRSPDVDIRFNKAPPNDFARQVEAVRQGVLTLAREVGGDDRSVINRQTLLSRWDAPAVPFSLEDRGAYAGRGLDLRDRLASKVELDRVVEIRRVSFAGHVYNLTSSEGWYDANGLIVSNCDCVMVPVTDWQTAHDEGLVASPRAAFEAGQVRGLSKSDAQAVADGADLQKVVNATRGTSAPGITSAYTATVHGHRVKATTEATTKRAAWRKANPTRLVRLRPEAIYAAAKDHEDAVRLLKLYGYIT